MMTLDIFADSPKNAAQKFLETACFSHAIKLLLLSPLMLKMNIGGQYVHIIHEDGKCCRYQT